MKGGIQGLVRLCLCQCKLDKGNVNYTCVKLIKKSNKLIFSCSIFCFDVLQNNLIDREEWAQNATTTLKEQYQIAKTISSGFFSANIVTL